MKDNISTFIGQSISMMNLIKNSLNPDTLIDTRLLRLLADRIVKVADSIDEYKGKHPSEIPDLEMPKEFEDLLRQIGSLEEGND